MLSRISQNDTILLKAKITSCLAVSSNDYHQKWTFFLSWLCFPSLSSMFLYRRIFLYLFLIWFQSPKIPPGFRNQCLNSAGSLCSVENESKILKQECKTTANVYLSDRFLKFVSLLTELLLICVSSYEKCMFVLVHSVISSKRQWFENVVSFHSTKSINKQLYPAAMTFRKGWKPCVNCSDIHMDEIRGLCVWSTGLWRGNFPQPSLSLVEPESPTLAS